MGKYRSLGTKFDNVYRNDLNANFDEIDKDIKAETTRAKQREDNIQAQVNTLVVNGDSSPAAAQAAVDAKGVDKGNLKQRLDDDYNELSSHLAQKAKNLEDLGINVKQPPFNAKLDGTTVETSLLRQIITYAENIGIKRIIIPSGEMVVGNVDIPSDFIIEGKGSLKKEPSAKGILNLIGDNIVIKDIGLYSLNYLSQDGYLIDVNGTNNKIIRCGFNRKESSKEYSAIRLNSLSKNTTIFNNDIYNCAYMIFAIDGASNISIGDNYFNGGITKATLSQDATYFSVEPVGDAIKLSKGIGGSFVRVIGNTFENIYRDCIDAFSTGVHVDFSHNICRNVDVLITDIKSIYRDPSDPLGSSNPNNPTRDFIISFNDIENVGIGQYDSRVFNVGHSTHITNGETYTDVAYAVQRVKIFGNKIKSSSRYGVYIRKCKNISVEFNELQGIIERNIYVVDECEDIEIFSNEIYLSPNINNIYGIVSNSANSKRVRVKNNKVFGPSHGGASHNIIGIWMQGAEYEIEGNSIFNARTGVNVNNLTGSVINDNKAYNCSTAGIRAGETGAVNKTTFKNNFLKDSVRGMLFNNALDKIIFTDNTFLNCATPWSGDSSLTSSITRNNDVIT